MTSHSDIVAFAARSTDVDLHIAIASALDARYGYDENQAIMSFQEAVVHSVTRSEEWGVNHGIMGLIALHNTDYDFLSEAYNGIGAPGLAMLFEYVDERVRKEGFTGCDDAEDTAYLFEGGPFGPASELSQKYDDCLKLYQDRVPAYIRSNLSHFAHLDLTRHLPPRERYFPHNPAFLITIQIWSKAFADEHDGRIPSLQEMKDHYDFDWLAWIKHENYLFMNIGRKFSEFDDPQPLVRYLKTINGATYQVLTDGTVTIFSDD